MRALVGALDPDITMTSLCTASGTVALIQHGNWYSV